MNIGGNPRYQVIVHRSTDTKPCIPMTTSDSHTYKHGKRDVFCRPVWYRGLDLEWCAKGDGSIPGKYCENICVLFLRHFINFNLCLSSITIVYMKLPRVVTYNI